MLVANDGSSEVYNLFGLDLISQDDGSQTRTLLADGLGSTRLEMVDGVVETTSSYEPFGKLLMQAGDSGTVYGYTGERYDSATNLVFLRARYYSPDLKVFMSRDPFPGVMTMPASQHGYSYAHNNPVNLTDPSGEVVLPIVIPIAFALILLALGIVAFANPPSAPVKLPDIDIDVDWQRLFRPEILAIVACSMLPKLLTELKQQWDEDGRPIPWSPDNNESNGKDIALG
ncbi:MAG: RHS repeat-associated core domain-containing protein [Chloroflexi bacterium]|nr:RHS repeat-associated core domain-containing protein [Chloroflexota bacterium]